MPSAKQAINAAPESAKLFDIPGLLVGQYAIQSFRLDALTENRIVTFGSPHVRVPARKEAGVNMPPMAPTSAEDMRRVLAWKMVTTGKMYTVRLSTQSEIGME